MTHESALVRSGAVDADELHDAWPAMAADERLEGFELLSQADAEDFFLALPGAEMAELVCGLPPAARRAWVRLAPPDDAADLIQGASPDQRELLLGLLDEPTRKEVSGLLAYREDEAGGLMSPRYVRLRPEMSVDEAISYLRRAARELVETIYYIYVLDADQCLVGVVSFRELFSASPEKKVAEVMRREFVSVAETMHQEAVARVIARSGLMAVPVLDAEGRVRGIVTMDDIVDVLREETTEDIQKLGGMEALDAPYLKIAFRRMVRKRASWLAALFLGEMLTATAMAFFEDEIAKAVILALFVPLIISSGGNSGSQASTLVIRAMALGEVRLRDWWRVVRRELGAGLVLGAVLGTIGFLRIVLWQSLSGIYGEHFLLVAITVFLSLIGVVTFGTLAGALLPFLLRKLGFDPASASAPFVATLVDVAGLLIYFGIAAAILRGTLL